MSEVGWGLIGASTIAADHMIGAIRAQRGHTVAAVASYEAAHKGRKTILRATKRQAA